MSRSPVADDGRRPQLDRLSNILKTFNEQFATLFKDADRVAHRFTNDIAPKVAADPAYQNAKQNTPQTARIEHDKALSKAMLELLKKDDTEFYKQFVQNPVVQALRYRHVVFGLTSAASAEKPPAVRRADELSTRLASSTDPRDRLGAELIAVFERQRRVTLGDALRAATRAGLTDADGLAAVERVARPQASRPPPPILRRPIWGNAETPWTTTSFSEILWLQLQSALNGPRGGGRVGPK